MPRRRVRLQDVADEAGLSKAAASYALRGLKGSPNTQARVRTIADRLGYIANPAAQALAEGRTGAVGICGTLNDPWRQGLAVGLAQRLADEAVAVSIVDTGAPHGANPPDVDRPRERQAIERMSRDHLDGAIVLVDDPTNHWWGEIDPRFAIVAVGDRLTHRPAAGAVDFDNVLGVSAGLRHLTDLGHRRIAVLTSSAPASPGRPARSVAEKFARRTGIALTIATPSTPSAAVHTISNLLTATEPPTALFCLSDDTAFAAYRAARQHGVRIAQDISVLGYDDHDLADLVAPPLTTFRWDRDAIIAAAIDQLLALLAHEPPTRVTVQPHLVERGSTAAPPD